MTPLEAARAYVRRGWRVIPVPHRSKNPGLRGWAHLRLSEEQLPAYFNREPMNIGLLTGEPSDWVVDIDLDHSRCVALADQFLPPTPAVFGRPGKPRSHRLFHTSAPVATRKCKGRSAGLLLELRATGQQTIVAPGTHPSGEAITWETNDAEPALVDPEVRVEAVEQLADAVRTEIGEEPLLRRLTTADSGVAAAPPVKVARSARRIRACVDAMLRMRVIDLNDGSGRLFAAACRVVEHDLDDGDGLAAIREHARQRPFPSVWTDEQILTRIRDAEQKTRRGIIRRASCDSSKVRIVVTLHPSARFSDFSAI